MDWMRELARHYAELRRRHPDDKLLLVFDIDGTILDMRDWVRWVLLAFDRAHGTSHFYGLVPADIDVHEYRIDEFLATRRMPAAERGRNPDWYFEHLWSPDALRAAHKAFRGVMNVIRWFQLQPNTGVALNTARPRPLREGTLRALNALGELFRVSFPPELVWTNPHDEEVEVLDAKIEGLRAFGRQGWRVIAMVDNEPANLEAMAAADESGEVLFLHADTLFESRRASTPRVVSGSDYHLTELVEEQQLERLPRRVQLVWHGVNDKANLRQFLASAVHWGECNVRVDPLSHLVLRHDSFDDTPWSPDEPQLFLEHAIAEFERHGKGLKLDLRQGDELLDRVLDVVATAGLDDEQLWFNAKLEVLGEAGFRQLCEAHPGAVLQCPVGFLTPLVLAAPELAHQVLQQLRQWGIDRFSLGWKGRAVRRAFMAIESWGYDVNIYDVPDLEAFLEAVLLLPRSLTSNFNFPEWHYFGRGPGAGGEFIHYQQR